MTRLFVAAWPPDDVVAELRALPRKDQRGVRFVPPENWHVTLRFLGAADPDAVGAALDAATFPAATARLGAGVDLLFERMLGYLTYLPAADIELVRQAWVYADKAHTNQWRSSGDPYITHPIAVTTICAHWKLDAPALMAALLHDAMEDCGITKPANVISTSYGMNEADVTPAYAIRQCNEYAKLGLMGTTLLYASGDYGVAGASGECSGPYGNPKSYIVSRSFMK